MYAVLVDTQALCETIYEIRYERFVVYFDVRIFIGNPFTLYEVSISGAAQGIAERTLPRQLLGTAQCSLNSARSRLNASASPSLLRTFLCRDRPR